MPAHIVVRQSGQWYVSLPAPTFDTLVAGPFATESEALDACLAEEVRPVAEEYATDLDRLLAFGDLIDRSSLKTPAELHTLNYAEQEGDVVLANSSNSQTLYRLTESGRRFISKFSLVHRGGLTDARL